MSIKKLLKVNYLFSILSISDLIFISYLSFEQFNFKKIGFSIISSFTYEFLVHIIFYFSLSLFLYFSFKLDWKIKSPVSIIIFITFILSLLIELVQEIFLSYRTFQAIDLLANIIGILLFCIFIKSLRFFLNK